ncbi:MAG TPA: hypothetical protein VER58_13795 [Thermoanaerobaculia bacterium]|nr:hypothetical protein [Thermoanaerobaculia bacterium]
MRKSATEAIAERLKQANFTESAQRELERTRTKIEPHLIRLLRHRDPFVRELAAEILGERRRAESIPALISKPRSAAGRLSPWWEIVRKDLRG